MIIVTVPGRGLVYFDGADADGADGAGAVVVEVDPDVTTSLILAGARGLRKLDELGRALEADVQRVLAAPAYRRDAFDSDGEQWRILPGTAAHTRAALLSLAPDAEIDFDDEDDVEAALREVDRL